MTATTANRAKSNSYLTKLPTRPIYRSSPQAGLILLTELPVYTLRKEERRMLNQERHYRLLSIPLVSISS